MAASYWEVRLKASSASRARVSAESDPPLFLSSSSTGAYWEGSVTTPTPPWFLAAPRIMLGPPMSMFSMASSNGHARLGHGLLEGVERHHHEVDRAYAMGLERLHVSRHVAPREDAAVDLRVERLDAAVEHLGEARHLRYVHHRHARVSQELGRAPVERISKPRAWSPFAKSTTPVLSCTLRSARLTVLMESP